MERLDYYDILPAGMDAYLSNHGHHFSKPMLEWAVKKMRDRNGARIQVPDRARFEEMMRANSVVIKNDKGYYDPMYVWCMGKADYLGSSIPDEMHLMLFVKDYLDDIDGSETRAFDEFYVKMLAMGVDIPWEDMI